MKLRNKYFILRHGQTIYQTKKKNYIYPWSDKPPVKLTQKGESQIKKVAKKLKTLKVDLIFSSDFFRTRQTAKIVVEGLNKRIHFDKRLRDVNLGIYRGRTKDEFYHDFPKYFKKRFYQKPKQGENWLVCQKRMLNFLKDIDKRHKGKTILIISHGDPLWLLEGALKSRSLLKLLKEKKTNFIKVGELRKL